MGKDGSDSMLQTIIEEIIHKGIVPPSHNNWRELKGGTNSSVGVLGTANEPNLYVVKSNTPDQIAAESRFYQLYRAVPLLPRTEYVDPEYRYMIYRYVSGETRYSRGTKQELLSDLVHRMINHYVQPERPGLYEWAEEPELVRHNMAYSRSVIGSHLEEADHLFIQEICIRRSRRVSEDGLYVLHGDFGVHNFLFAEGVLSGIIDPWPVTGRPLYDLLYAFCSSPDDLELSILLTAVRQMNTGPIHLPDLIEDMMIALYSRISTCLCHHPEDLAAYQVAWKKWRQMGMPGHH
jgi:hypothetical protein